MEKKQFIAPLFFVLFAAFVAFFIIRETSHNPSTDYRQPTVQNVVSKITITSRERPWQHIPLELKKQPEQLKTNIMIDVKAPSDRKNANLIISDDFGLYVDGTPFIVDSILASESENPYRLIFLVDRSYSANEDISGIGKTKHDLFNEALRGFWNRLQYSNVDFIVYFFHTRRATLFNHAPALPGPYKVQSYSDLRYAINENDSSTGGTPLAWSLDKIYKSIRDTVSTHIIVLTDGIDTYGGSYPQKMKDNVYFHSFAGLSEMDRRSRRFESFFNYITEEGGLISMDWDSLFFFVDRISARASSDLAIFCRPRIDVSISPSRYVFSNVSFLVQERPFIDRTYFAEEFQSEISDEEFEIRFQPYITEIAERMERNPQTLLVLTASVSEDERKSEKAEPVISNREKHIAKRLVNAGIPEDRLILSSDNDITYSTATFQQSPGSNLPRRFEPWFRHLPCDDGSGFETDKSDKEMIGEHNRSVLISAVPFDQQTIIRWHGRVPTSARMEFLLNTFVQRFPNIESYISGDELQVKTGRADMYNFTLIAEHLRKNPESYIVFYYPTDTPLLAEDRLRFALRQGLRQVGEEDSRQIVESSFVIPNEFCFGSDGEKKENCRRMWRIESSLMYRPITVSEANLHSSSSLGNINIEKFDTSETVKVVSSLAIADEAGNILSPWVDKASLDLQRLPIKEDSGVFKIACRFHWSSGALEVSISDVSYSNEFTIEFEEVSTGYSRQLEQYAFDSHRPKSSFFHLETSRIAREVASSEIVPVITIYGNTCPIGSDIRNKELSLERTWFLAKKINQYAKQDIRFIAYPCYSKPPVVRNYEKNTADTLDMSYPENRDIARSTYIEYSIE